MANNEMQYYLIGHSEIVAFSEFCGALWDIHILSKQGSKQFRKIMNFVPGSFRRNFILLKVSLKLKCWIIVSFAMLLQITFFSYSNAQHRVSVQLTIVGWIVQILKILPNLGLALWGFEYSCGSPLSAILNYVQFMYYFYCLFIVLQSDISIVQL